MEKEDIIAADKKKYPGCFHSEASQMNCSNSGENGEFICETIRSIQRMCPRQRPVTIFSSKEQSDDVPGGMLGMFGGGGRVAGAEEFGQSDPFSMLESIFGGNFPGVSIEGSTGGHSHRGNPHAIARHGDSKVPVVAGIPGEARGPIERV